LPTILAAAGDPNIVEACLKGHKAGDKTYKVHLDGYNLIPSLKGEAKEWPRKEMLYWSDDDDLMALRYDKWKMHFVEQRAERFKVWSEPFVKLRVPLIFNLRSDPFEKGQHESIYYPDWQFVVSSCSCRRKPMWPNGSPASKSFHRGKSQPALASMR